MTLCTPELEEKSQDDTPVLEERLQKRGRTTTLDSARREVTESDPTRRLS